MALTDVADRIRTELDDVHGRQAQLRGELDDLDRQEKSLRQALQAVTGRSAAGSRRARRPTTAARPRGSRASNGKVDSAALVAHVRDAGHPVSVDELKKQLKVEGRSLGGMLGGLVRQGQLTRTDDGAYEPA